MALWQINLELKAKRIYGHTVFSLGDGFYRVFDASVMILWAGSSMTGVTAAGNTFGWHLTPAAWSLCWPRLITPARQVARANHLVAFVTEVEDRGTKRADKPLSVTVRQIPRIWAGLYWNKENTKTTVRWLHLGRGSCPVFKSRFLWG